VPFKTTDATRIHPALAFTTFIIPFVNRPRPNVAGTQNALEMRMNSSGCGPSLEPAQLQRLARHVLIQRGMLQHLLTLLHAYTVDVYYAANPGAAAAAGEDGVLGADPDAISAAFGGMPVDPGFQLEVGATPLQAGVCGGDDEVRTESTPPHPRHPTTTAPDPDPMVPVCVAQAAHSSAPSVPQGVVPGQVLGPPGMSSAMAAMLAAQAAGGANAGLGMESALGGLSQGLPPPQHASLPPGLAQGLAQGLQQGLPPWALASAAGDGVAVGESAASRPDSPGFAGFMSGNLPPGLAGAAGPGPFD